MISIWSGFCLLNLVKQLLWMVRVGLVEPAVHEGGKVVELLLLEHGGCQHRLVGDPLLRAHLEREVRIDK